MIQEPKCYTRKCRHFIGVIQPDGTEMTETVNCSAYLNGIPEDIAYGDSKHLTIRDGQNNEIVFEPK